MSPDEKVNILLVDDQPSRLLTYDAILAELGQNLVHARSGAEALQRLMEREFAVILLDINMPEMDGFETASLIHEHPRFENTPIIFVTGVHVTDLDRLRGYSLGAVDYVYIPIVPEILRSKVSVLVELHLKRLELQRLNQTLEAANAELAKANNSLRAEKQRELELLNDILERANAELAEGNRALAKEVSERRRAEAALKEADRRKDEFLAILSHELRNPLSPLRTAVGVMCQAGTDDRQLALSRGVIERQVHHLTRLVDELLDVSRITRGIIKLRPEMIDLRTVVGNAIETARPIIDEQGLNFTIELPDEPLLVEGDATRLSQIVSNLLFNAAKYTDRGGHVRLRVATTPNGATPLGLISVTDTGVGIPQYMLPRVFELFTQVAHTTHRAQGGLGVGLALVKHLVELHGGSVEAHSRGMGLGSEFTVRIPLRGSVALAAATPPAEPVAPRRRKSQSPHRILVADDNRDAALSLRLLLELEGHEVCAAYDGMEAVDLAASFRPDIAFLDIGMPTLDGYGVARWIREQPWGQSVELVALTGWGQQEDRRRAQEAGFNSHIVKPVDPQHLLQLLNARPAVDPPRHPARPSTT